MYYIVLCNVKLAAVLFLINQWKRNSIMRIRSLLMNLILLTCLSGCAVLPVTPKYQSAKSFDGVPISYAVYGDKPVTLVFVHGWSCDSRYWNNQVPYFETRYRVVTVDLAGHGHSGMERTDYTMEAFGQDVNAVVDQIGARKVILIGHSMGGTVIAEAARLMPDRVIGIIGVDTIQNLERRFTPEEYTDFTAPFESDFRGHTDSFVREMFVDSTDPKIVEWVAADMSSAPPHVGISALKSYAKKYLDGTAPDVFESLDIPVRAVNADLWTTDAEANRRHMKSFEVTIIKNAGHFIMLDRARDCNSALDAAIAGLLEK